MNFTTEHPVALGDGAVYLRMPSASEWATAQSPWAEDADPNDYTAAMVAAFFVRSEGVEFDGEPLTADHIPRLPVWALVALQTGLTTLVSGPGEGDVGKSGPTAE